MADDTTIDSGAIEDNEWLISSKHSSLNPEKYFIVIPAMFGNSQSSSPSNMTGEVAGIKFPHTSIYDVRFLGKWSILVTDLSLAR